MERHVDEARPGADVSHVGHAEAVRRPGREPPLDQVEVDPIVRVVAALKLTGGVKG